MTRSRDASSVAASSAPWQSGTPAYSAGSSPRLYTRRMRGKLRLWWPALKAALCLAILFAIGRQLARDLQKPDLWRRPLHPGWLALSGLLYLLGIGTSALYWRRLLGHLGQRAGFLSVVRA